MFGVFFKRNSIVWGVFSAVFTTWPLWYCLTSGVRWKKQKHNSGKRKKSSMPVLPSQQSPPT